MKNALKIIGIILLVMIILIVILLIWLLNKPTVPNNYFNTVKTGGAIEAKYIKMGKHSVSNTKLNVMENFKSYEIWYPSEITLSDKKFSVIIMNNGTGVKASKYKALFEHLASWGFIVVGTEEEYSWNAFSSEMSLRLMIKLNENAHVPAWDTNPFYGKVDLEHIGVAGHSQGGVGAINAVTDTKHADMYKAIFAASTTNKELADALEWDFDVTQIDIPVFLLAGTGKIDSETILPLHKMHALYEDIPSDTKIMVRRNDGDHGDMLYFADGYMTAFFMWQLQGDIEASKAFIGNDAEILSNNYYQDIKKNY